MIAFGTLALALAVRSSAEDAGGLGTAEPLEAKLRARWEPRLAVGVGVMTQSLKGSAIVPTQTVPAKLSDSGDSYISPVFKLGFDILTPIELEIPLRPRLVLRSSFQIPISTGLIANRADASYDQGKAGFAQNCPAAIGTPPAATNTCTIQLRNRATINYQWTAGLGVDLTLPVAEGQYHFMQGFEYIGMAIQAEGTYLRRSTASGFLQNETEFIDLKGDAELLHGISLTETFLVDAYDGRWVDTGFFLEGRVSWFATDRDPSVDTTTSRGQFYFVSSANDPEPFQYQIQAGVTFRFETPGQ